MNSNYFLIFYKDGVDNIEITTPSQQHNRCLPQESDSRNEYRDTYDGGRHFGFSKFQIIFIFRLNT